MAPAADRSASTAEGSELAGFDALGMAAFMVDRTGTILRRSAHAASDFPSGTRIDQALRTLSPSGELRDWTSVLKSLPTGTPTRLPATLADAESEEGTTYLVRCARLGDQADNAPRFLLVVDPASSAPPGRDEWSDLPQRLASLGKLAARVAHELNNPLDGILRYINLAIRLAEQSSQTRIESYLNESRSGVLRMASIITDLLEYSRSAAAALEGMDVNQVIEEAIRTHAAAADATRVVIAADFQSSRMPVFPGNRLLQVCGNIIRNALDAMPDGGRLTVTCGIHDEQIVIRFADTGPGLPDPPNRVFEPFFTTKPPGKGTGLGLAICRDFIEDMGGSITAEQAAPGGAVFLIRLPLPTQPDEASETSQRWRPAPTADRIDQPEDHT